MWIIPIELAAGDWRSDNFLHGSSKDRLIGLECRAGLMSLF